MISIDELSAKASYVRSAIERNAEKSATMAVGRTSGFWQDIFDQRRIYPNLNDLLVCRRQGTILGIGDDPQGTVDRERDYSERVHMIFRESVDPRFVASLPETSFGSPYVFEHDGISRSANFWINSATTRRVLDFVERYGAQRPLRILEIGPGWGGCVHQLHNAANVESYTLVDLPENLFISTVHLGTTLADRRLEFIDVDGDAVDTFQRGQISACLPGAIGRIRAKFDVVLNSFSLQEMNLDSVQHYIDWIQGILSETGIFVSLNSHGKAGVALPSDYKYEKFHIHHWGVFRRYPGGFYNTIPYEVVVGPRKSDSPTYSQQCQNALGRLIQLGLDSDIDPFCAALVKGGDTSTLKILSDSDAIFTTKNDRDRLSATDALAGRYPSPVFPYIKGLLHLVQNDVKASTAALTKSIDSGLGGFARAKADLLLSVFTKRGQVVASSIDVNGFNLAKAYPEAKLILETGDLSAMIAHTNRVLEREER